jgi:hypothetical protein
MRVDLLADNLALNVGGSTLVGAQNVNRIPIDIAAGLGAQNVNLALAFTWTGVSSLFGFEIAALPKPERTQLRTTDWIDLGGSMWIQGILLTCNTFGITRTVQLQVDGNPVGGSEVTLSVTHNGELQIPYAFSPLIGHRIRLTPQDGSEVWEVFAIVPVGTKSPEAVTIWEPQPTSHQLRGYMHVREVRPKVQGTAGTTCTIATTCEFGSFSLQVPLTGQVQKPFVACPPNKGQIYSWSVTAPAVRVWAEDFEISCKSWGESGPYVVVRPFGEVGSEGARI